MGQRFIGRQHTEARARSVGQEPGASARDVAVPDHVRPGADVRETRNRVAARECNRRSKNIGDAGSRCGTQIVPTNEVSGARAQNMHAVKAENGRAIGIQRNDAPSAWSVHRAQGFVTAST